MADNDSLAFGIAGPAHGRGVEPVALSLKYFSRSLSFVIAVVRAWLDYHRNATPLLHSAPCLSL